MRKEYKKKERKARMEGVSGKIDKKKERKARMEGVSGKKERRQR